MGQSDGGLVPLSDDLDDVGHGDEEVPELGVAVVCHTALLAEMVMVARNEPRESQAVKATDWMATSMET